MSALSHPWRWLALSPRGCSRSPSRPCSCCACPRPGSGWPARPPGGRRGGCPRRPAWSPWPHWSASRSAPTCSRRTTPLGPGRLPLHRGPAAGAGLPLDPTRSYAESTLYWVIWYIGLPAVLLGGFGLALLARSCVRALLTWGDPAGAWRNWAPPLAISCAAPSPCCGTPTSCRTSRGPAAAGDRRSARADRLRAVGAGVADPPRPERGARPVTAGLAGVFCVAALVLRPRPPRSARASATRGAGKPGPERPGLAFQRTGVGETGAVKELCGPSRGTPPWLSSTRRWPLGSPRSSGACAASRPRG